MHGLSVRWSLTDAPSDVLDRLRDYVENESHAKFAGLSGLRFKTWRAREGEGFEGTYVFDTELVRDEFRKTFEESAATSPVSELIVAGPVAIDDFEVVAIAEGPAGFRRGAGPEALLRK